MEQEKDQRLWRMAQKRAAFKKNLFSYMIIIAFLWALWWITQGRRVGFSGQTPWPVWVMLGWGIVIGFQYFNAYNGSTDDLVSQEYEKLRKQQ